MNTQKNFRLNHSNRSTDVDCSTSLNLGRVPERVAGALLMAVFLLAVAGFAARLVDLSLPVDSYRGVREIAMRFDLDRENNIPAWYSSTALLGAAFLLGLIGLMERNRCSRFSIHWIVLAFVFLYLSIDEATYLHEILIVPLRNRLGTSGIFYFAWVIPAFFVVTAFALAYISFLIHLERRTRVLIIVAGAIFVGGALGVELAGGAMADQFGLRSVSYTIVMMIEELLEMLGIVLFIYALLSYLRKQCSQWRLVYQRPALASNASD